MQKDDEADLGLADHGDRFEAFDATLQDRLIIMVAIAALTFGNQRMRRHSRKVLDKLVRSIERFGVVRPILIDQDHRIIDGEGLVEAARELGLTEVPAIVVDHLTPAELKALRIALNRLQELGEWDEEVLKAEFETIIELDAEFELDVTGFEVPEIDRLLTLDSESEQTQAEDPADVLPELTGQPAVSRPGDRFLIDGHAVCCGDALDPEVLQQALGGETSALAFTDPPYNVRIDGNVGGLGQIKHREFAMASGEMSPEAFADFLRKATALMVAHLREGAVLYICMDWRSIDLLMACCRELGLALLNICVWVKSNGGMGSFYRSRHELVLVARKGTTSHLNNVQLGRFKRYRTNVWEYAGMNAFSSDRQEQLASHPTVKPVALVHDAILDCTKRGDLVLDPFGGSGTTMIAAQKAGRRACLVELDPAYVDLIIRRYERQFGAKAIHEATGLTFAELEARRLTEAQNAPQPARPPLLPPRIRTRKPAQKAA